MVQIQETLKSLAPEVPLLAPVALNWALTMHRFYSSLIHEDEDDSEKMPGSHVPAMVNTRDVSLMIDSTL